MDSQRLAIELNYAKVLGLINTLYCRDSHLSLNGDLLDPAATFVEFDRQGRTAAGSPTN